MVALLASTLNSVNAQCDIPKTIPYIENFYTGTPPNNLILCSKSETLPGYDGLWKGSPNPLGGGVFTDFGNYSNGIRTWWFTPKILVEAGRSYRLTFDYRGLSQPLAPTFMLVKFGTCDTIDCMTTLISAISLVDEVKRTHSKVFTPGITDTINLGFYEQASQIDGCAVVITNFSLVEDIPTPVTMGMLTAQVQGNNTNLYFQTYTEQNNKGFSVEQSVNGQPFTALGFVPTKATNGNSILPISYQYTVTGIAPAQYRLQQQDFNGTLSYSNIVSVTGKAKSFAIKVLPNPIANNLHVSIYSPTAYKGFVQITSSTGRQVHSQAVNLPAGFSSLSIPATQWPAGSYFIKVNGVVARFIK